MPFTDAQKKEVRRRAGYKCCLCQTTSASIEIHHIIPQEVGGSDDIDNAAPLCPNCHSDLGGNEEKQTRIKEARDWWYEIVKQRYSPADFTTLNLLQTELSDIGSNLPQIKEELKEFINLKINAITPQNAQMVVSNLSTSAVVGLMPVGNELWKKVTDLEKENKELKNRLYIKENLVFRNNALWSPGEDEPYCSRCLEVDQKYIHLLAFPNPAFYKCPNCDAQAVRAKPHLDPPDSFR